MIYKGCGKWEKEYDWEITPDKSKDYGYYFGIFYIPTQEDKKYPSLVFTGYQENGEIELLNTIQIDRFIELLQKAKRHLNE